GGAGPAKGRSIRKEDFEKMLDAYYKLRGWDKNGMPKEVVV
ncbi:MAG: aldehyde ferredoxin oxidoreductase C-terminal domain-containing protein, partial [Methanobacteriota archaeon]